ncbi:hypothetical protein [Corallococcus sp. AS-1-12]|uniref:hypothetical protein n=1 Tax=Corallococcus sp. AS-1-12 TaxID=2874598 RepID=UPI001CBDCE35|nr:hypothetical protein [Corallococcus sp. AS-1-12]MBZ4335925.1 hypothetical protein [Corallococcus sp. AS-1-12]
MVDMFGMPAAQFVSLLRNLHPKWVMDLRVVPFFDLGGASRRWFFELFEELDIQYQDVSGYLGEGPDDTAYFRQAAGVISSVFTAAPAHQTPGTTLVLLERRARAQAAKEVLPGLLKPTPKGGWNTTLLSVHIPTFTLHIQA